MAPTEGRVAKPGRRWDCCRGTPGKLDKVEVCWTTMNNIKT